MKDFDLQTALRTAQLAAVAASAVAMKYFRQPMKLEYKSDKSIVTIADKEAEQVILDVIRQQYPDHSVLTEESGSHHGDAEARWIIDPIDGTRGFSRGGDFWGPIIALEYKGEIVVGAIALPALQKTYWAAKGLGAFCNGARLAVSQVSTWGDAILSIGNIRALLQDPAWKESLVLLITSATQTRCYGDLASCAMVLEGRADAWIESDVKSWDISALKILVEEAGGVFTDFAGSATIHSGNAIAGNRSLWEYIRRKLNAIK